MVSPPADAAKIAALNTAANRPAGRGTTPDSTPDTARSAAPAASERADIRPLDLAGALQILIAEVRAELTLLLLQSMDTSNPASTHTSSNVAAHIEAVLPAARDILQSVLQSLPENSQEVAAWSAALPAVDAAVELGLARAAAIIETWREVPGAVVASAKDLRMLVAKALSDEPLNPIWLRPEGLNLAPRLMRLRRRRKFLQRRLTDPDYQPSFFDDPEPLT